MPRNYMQAPRRQAAQRADMLEGFRRAGLCRPGEDGTVGSVKPRAVAQSRKSHCGWLMLRGPPRGMSETQASI